MDDRIKIIIDTDAGDDIDDAFAVALAVNSPEVDILGITTVYRNSFLRAKIVSYLIELYGKDIPVYCGEDTPINDQIVTFGFEENDEKGKPLINHYSEEMKDAKVMQEHAVDFILETIDKNPNEVVLVALGPLTNLALAYKKNPAVFCKLKGIHMMGGDPFFPTREWNIRCDAEAAKVIYSCGVPITMIGFNVTKLCAFSNEDFEFFNALKHPACKILVKMMTKWLVNNKYVKQPTMHDGLAIACLFKNYCNFVDVPLIVLMDETWRGRTIIPPEKKKALNNVKVAVNVDTEGFIDFLKQRLK